MHDAFCILRNCSEETVSNKVCFNGNSQSYPIELDTQLWLREITNINEEKNSITLQMILCNRWTDSTLDSSKTTKT